MVTDWFRNLFGCSSYFFLIFQFFSIFKLCICIGHYSSSARSGPLYFRFVENQDSRKINILCGANEYPNARLQISVALTNFQCGGLRWNNIVFMIDHPSDLGWSFIASLSTPRKRIGGYTDHGFQTPLASESHLGAQTLVLRSMLSTQE